MRSTTSVSVPSEVLRSALPGGTLSVGQAEGLREPGGEVGLGRRGPDQAYDAADGGQDAGRAAWQPAGTQRGEVEDVRARPRAGTAPAPA